MSIFSPTFITNREVDHFLGGGERGPRKRQRLRNDNQLPVPAQIGRVRRFNIALFPRFALVGLVGGLSRLPGASDAVMRFSQRAFELGAFAHLADAVRASASEMDDWRFDVLLSQVAHRAEPALREWSNCIASYESELEREFGIGFETVPGTIERVESGLCVVLLQDGVVERFVPDRVAVPVVKGCPVAIERVRVAGSEMGFVMPATTDIPDTQERELAAWFSEMMTSEPVGEAAAEHDDELVDALPYRRSRPRQASWRGASTMSRVRVGG